MSESGFPQVPLEFGMFDWIESTDRPNYEVYEHKLRLAEIADRGGLWGWHIAEHTGTPLSIDGAPSVLLSAAIQRTTRLRLGALTWCLPWNDPYRFYNEICMLDQMSQGRIELGVGRGVSPFESAYYGMDNVQRSRDVYRENFAIFLEACKSDVLNYEGTFHSYKSLDLFSHPYQKPYPPLWFPSSNREGIEFTAAHGYHTAHNTGPQSEIRDLFDHYREVWVQHRDDPDRHNAHVPAPKLATSKHIVVADTDAEAEKWCRQAHQEWADHIGWLGRKMGRAGGREGYDARAKAGYVMAGTPKAVAQQMIDSIRESTANYVMVVVSFGKLPQDVAAHSLDLFAREVAPAVKVALSA